MIVAIGDSLNDLTSSDATEDGEDEDEEVSEQGKRSEDNEPGWVMGTMFQTLQQHWERFRQKQMMLDKWIQPGWGDPADIFPDRHQK